jgi:SEC-C motif-containing protein
MPYSKSVLRSICPCQVPVAAQQSKTLGETKALFAQCCAPYLMGESHAPSAHLLMRSRYSAYATANEAYLRLTWHPDKRPGVNEPLISPTTKWVGLDVLSHQVLSPTTAQVEFVAKYKEGGRAQLMKELSNFVSIDSKWVYVDAL